MMKKLAFGMAAIAAAYAAEALPVDVSFARGAWNRDDFTVVHCSRFAYTGLFDQLDYGISNHCPDMSAEEVFRKHCGDVYSALVYREKFQLGVTVSSKMAWDWEMAPIIVIAEDLGKDAKGAPEFRDHWEVCLYNRGINLWYHYFVNGKQTWYKAASVLLPEREWYAKNVAHDLRVTVAKNRRGEKEITITCGDYTINHTDDKLPDSFYAGIIGCEGRNFFYDFRVEQKK